MLVHVAGVLAVMMLGLLGALVAEWQEAWVPNETVV